ncbi:MAG: hypothetical protein JXO22_08710, partial [Phycisphaerae bacterium]|nr:hypothetical protein [Phycisphaerae bacterium]
MWQMISFALLGACCALAVGDQQDVGRDRIHPEMREAFQSLREADDKLRKASQKVMRDMGLDPAGTGLDVDKLES